MEIGKSWLEIPVLRWAGNIEEVAGIGANSIYHPEVRNLLTTRKENTMKRNLNIRILALAMSLLLGTLPVLAEERPFALTGNGVATFITDAAGNITGANVTGSGTATHLGGWILVGTVEFTADPSNPGHFLSSATPTLIAANGDKLQVSLHGSLDPAAGLDGGPIQFVGGTGRFSGASGSGNFAVEINPATGAFKLTMVGNINY